MSHRTEDDSTSGGSDSEKHRLPASTRPGREIRRMGAVRKTLEKSAERRGRSSSRTHRVGSASSENNPKEWTGVERPEGNGKQPKATEKRREGSPLVHPRDPSAHKPKATIPNSIHTETHYRSASVDRNKITNSPSPPRSKSPFESTKHDAYALEVARRGDEIPPPDKERLARREEIEKSHLTNSIPSVQTSTPSPPGTESPFRSTKHDAYALEVARRGREPPPDRERLAGREKIEKSHLTTSNSSVRTSSPSPLRSESPFASNEPDAYEFEVASKDKKKKRLAQKEEMLTTPSSSVRTSSAGSAGPQEAKKSWFTEDLPKASSSTSIPSNWKPKRKLWESFGDPKRQGIIQENLEQADKEYPLTKDQADEVAEATCQAWLGGKKRKK